MDCLGGAQGPSEQSSEIQSVKIAMGVECHLLKAVCLEGGPGSGVG